MTQAHDTLVIVTLPGGDAAALTLAEVTAARRRAAELGFRSLTVAAAPAPQPERLLNSKELAALTGVGDTTLEAMAARGEIPHLRIGKALRFELSSVKAALRGA
jgi:excisionase family DNA binding protein